MTADAYTHIADLAKEVEIPANGILSRTLFNDEQLRVVLFGFDTGQELTAHTAPMPAILHILQGDATLTLGSDSVEGHAGTWIRMKAQLEHSIHAKTPVVLLLMMLKQEKK